jgi:hypothetical protein
MPGLIGLNNMKQNDYANVIVQAVMRILPIRCARTWGRRGMPRLRRPEANRV